MPNDLARRLRLLVTLTDAQYRLGRADHARASALAALAYPAQVAALEPAEQERLHTRVR